TDASGRDHLLELHVQRIEAIVVTDHSDSPRGFPRVEQRRNVGDLSRYGLLEINMKTALERRLCSFRMKRCWQAYNDGVSHPRGQKLAIVCCLASTLCNWSACGQHCRIGVGNSNDREVVQPPK